MARSAQPDRDPRRSAFAPSNSVGDKWSGDYTDHRHAHVVSAARKRRPARPDLRAGPGVRSEWTVLQEAGLLSEVEGQLRAASGDRLLARHQDVDSRRSRNLLR